MRKLDHYGCVRGSATINLILLPLAFETHEKGREDRSLVTHASFRSD